MPHVSVQLAAPLPKLPAGVRFLERGWLSSNSVLLRGPQGAALIDSGYGSHAQQTMALVKSELGGEPLALLINTHLHSDHCGGNAILQSAYPAMRTLIPPGQADAVGNWDPVALSYVPTGQYCPRFGFDEPLLPGTRLHLGEQLWQVHAAPGHDPHSVILFEPQSRTLVSADALWENGFGVVFQELEGEGAFSEVAETLDLIERLGPNLVLPGHGRAFTDVTAAIARSRSRLDAYVRDPQRHAAHAAKVLLKFKLLELRSLPVEAFLEWGSGTAYFQLVHHRWFGDRALRHWMAELLLELERAGALTLQDGQVMDVS